MYQNSKDTSARSLVGLTGASGFIGSYLRMRLGEGYLLRSLSRSEIPEAGAGAIQGDLRDTAVTGRFIQGLDSLIHLAGSNFPRDAGIDLVEDIEANLVVTVRLFETFARANPGGHLIFFSSGGAVYDPTLPAQPRKESDRTRPISSYGIQKLSAELFLESICSRSGLRGTILRVSNPYGTLLSPKRRQGIVGVALSCIREGRTFQLFGSPETTRDYIHLDDLYRALQMALNLPPPAGSCHLYNLGSGVGVRTLDLLRAIERAAGRQLKINYAEATVSEPSWNVLDIQKIRGELGWEPRIPLREGLMRIEGHVLP